MRRFIVLMTDYGYRDTYVGVVKGVIKSINPDIEIIDLTHGVERHNILEAAVMLTVSARYFPQGTIFVVVVDPGVGSSRRAVVIETDNYILIGPDNGCLTLLAELDGVKRVIDISNTKYRLPYTSHTFHGRDVFAPVAAWISRGIPLGELGPEIEFKDLVKIEIPEAIVDRETGVIETSVIYIDIYGNIMTNAKSKSIETLDLKYGDRLSIEIGNERYECIFETSFSKIPVGQLACYINSWGYLEVAINMGNAASTLGVRQGSRIVVKKTK